MGGRGQTMEGPGGVLVLSACASGSPRFASGSCWLMEHPDRGLVLRLFMAVGEISFGCEFLIDEKMMTSVEILLRVGKREQSAEMEEKKKGQCWEQNLKALAMLLPGP